MKPEHIKDLQSNEVVRKRLAKVMAKRCFWDTNLEDLHPGQYPGSKASDYST
jgi:hypothetical protein